MVNETILAIIIAFAISAALCPVVIPFLHRLKFGQQVRDDGPQSHLKKQKYVKSYHLGEFGEGDAGVTIAEFE